MTANLASLHKFELSRQRQTDKVTNKSKYNVNHVIYLYNF